VAYAGVEIRDAEDDDLAGLNGLEARSFASDRLSPESLRRLLRRRSARLRVAAKSGNLLGYHLVLFRAGASVARLYSIAVDGAVRGGGLGRRLLADAEAVAARNGQKALRLEVREDNMSAIRLYEKEGYRPIGCRRAYYADGADAIRYEKPLARAMRERVAHRKRRGRA
jgi:ribosomal-protein-alanine acetyltransferase